MVNKLSNRQKILVVVILLLLVIGYSAVVAVSRMGKTKVSIEVIPSDSYIYIDKEKSSSGDVYLKPGKYAFTAKKDGFLNDKIIAYIGGEDVKIGLAPFQNSEKARQWIKNNPDLQLKREALAAGMAELKGKYVVKNTPIIDSLPFTSVEGPFSIDYGQTNSRQYGTFLVVSDSVPVGRESALGWIREEGYDPTDFEIRYSDFQNPLLNTGMEVPQ